MRYPGYKTFHKPACYPLLLFNSSEMAEITHKGQAVHTIGRLPVTGSDAPGFTLVKTDLTETSLNDYRGKKVILNIFPSIDTSTCAASERRFNEAVGDLKGAVVISVSMDLPYALRRFCAAEGIAAVIPGSAFRSPGFGKDYGVLMTDGRMKGLFSRAVVVIDEQGRVVYSEQVPEINREPDYAAALRAAG